MLEDEKLQPITYNHYFTDNVQKARQGVGEAMINKIYDKDFNREQALSLLEITVADMDQQACNEARAELDAYYKVNFVQVISPGIL